VLLSVTETRAQPDRPPQDAPANGTSAAAEAKALFTFPRAAELMGRHSPALKEVAAEHKTALALAKVKTPLPNPSLALGPEYGFGPDVAKDYRWQPFGSLGFAIPTGKRLRRQDELNRLNAEQARAEVQVRHRELYLGLRRLYAEWVLSHSRLEVRRELAAASDKSLELSRKLEQGGKTTALELGLLELEAARVKAEVLDVESEIAGEAGELSLAVGVHADHFLPLPAPALPEVPGALPDLKELHARLTANHPELARLRARYEVAEGELRLEIAKQYPDLQLGPSAGREVGEGKTVFGLTLGIELPVFDRNQQGIATASQRREEIRARYEAAANRALASLERAWQKVRVATEKRKLVETGLLPKAQANLDLARKALDAGATDALHFLEAQRGQRATVIEALDAQSSLWAAWVELESSVGCPLFLFPGEKQDAAPEAASVVTEPQATGKKE
jgi:CRISPR system Cascade subunit CasA